MGLKKGPTHNDIKWQVVVVIDLLKLLSCNVLQNLSLPSLDGQQVLNQNPNLGRENNERNWNKKWLEVVRKRVLYETKQNQLS